MSAETVNPDDGVQCGECAALHGNHLAGCGLIQSGMSLGKRPGRSPWDLIRYKRLKATMQTMPCRRCEGPADHPHHFELVQVSQSRGKSWAEIDSPGKVIPLCAACHGWVHAAVNTAAAVAANLLAPQDPIEV